MNDPLVRFTTEPLNLGPFLAFMEQDGTLRGAPKDWREMMFADQTN
jgi:hypothetical protein